jgi:anion transporter
MEAHNGGNQALQTPVKVKATTSRQAVIWVIGGALVALLVMLLPLALERPAHIVLAIFVFTIALWIGEVLPMGISALLWTVLLVVFVGIKTLPEAVIFSGFAKNTFWLLLGAFLIGEAMTKTKLAHRIAYHLMAMGGSSYKRVVFFLWVASFILALLVPSGAVRMAIMIPIMLGIGGAFGVKLNTKFSVNILLNVYWASMCGEALFYTASNLNLTAMGVLKTVTGFAPSWIGWFVWMIVPVIVMTVGVYFIVNKLFSPEKEYLVITGGVEGIQQRLDALGPVSPEERRALIFFVITLVLWVTEPFHKINSAYVALMMGAALFLPGIGVLEISDVSKISWNTLILMGVALGMGAVLTTVKLDTWLITTLLDPILTPFARLGTMGGSFGISLFCGIVHFLIPSGSAQTAALSPLLIKYAATTGFNPTVMALIIPRASSQTPIFPYESVPLMVLWGSGYMNMKACLKTFGVITLFLIAWLTVMGPFWAWITSIVRF